MPGLPRGNLTVAVLKSRLQMYGGAMFVLYIKTRYKASVWKYKCTDCAHYFCSPHCKEM